LSLKEIKELREEEEEELREWLDVVDGGCEWVRENCSEDSLRRVKIDLFEGELLVGWWLVVGERHRGERRVEEDSVKKI
jgi:hypothetical protein